MVDKRAAVRGIGQATTPGVVGEAETAPAVYGESSNGPGGEFRGVEIGSRTTLVTPASSYLQTIAEFRRETTATPATSGIGGALDVKVEEPSGDVSLASRWTVERGNETVVVGLRTVKGEAAGTNFIKATEDADGVVTELPAHKPADNALATHSGANPPGWSRYVFGAADLVALGEVTTATIELCELVRGHVLHAVLVNVVAAESACDTCVGSVGYFQALDAFLLEFDLQSASALYGEDDDERGTTMSGGALYVCPNSMTVLLSFTVTGDGLDFTDVEDLVFEVYLLVSKIPSMTAEPVV